MSIDIFSYSKKHLIKLDKIIFEDSILVMTFKFVLSEALNFYIYTWMKFQINDFKWTRVAPRKKIKNKTTNRERIEKIFNIKKTKIHFYFLWSVSLYFKIVKILNFRI